MSGSWPCACGSAPCCCGVVKFDCAIWSARYPQLVAQITPFEAGGAFTIAGLYLSNEPTSLVRNLQIRGTILGMITAHLIALTLRARAAGDASGGIVGRIGTASEGSVSVTAELDTPQSAAWWAQTEFGLSAWQALAPYRTAVYFPAPQIPLGAQSYPFGFAFFGRR